jgi:hypothetical protein
MQDLIKAVDLALAGQWHRAHETVQAIEDRKAYWIHAVLHKIEGDSDNSRFWYSRAGKTQNVSMDPNDELRLILRELSDVEKKGSASIQS